MAETTWAELRALLAERYWDFKSHLTRRFGSEDIASESLHETWLRLHRPGNVGPLRNGSAYLLRVAFNIATDRLRADSRNLRRSEIDAVLNLADPGPGPAREIEARAELAALARAIAELPERSRAILVAARMEGLSHQRIADRHGISRRTVLYELERAIAFLEARLETNVAEHCAAPTLEPSMEQASDEL